MNTVPSRPPGAAGGADVALSCFVVSFDVKGAVRRQDGGRSRLEPHTWRGFTLGGRARSASLAPKANREGETGWGAWLLLQDCDTATVRRCAPLWPSLPVTVGPVGVLRTGM